MNLIWIVLFAITSEETNDRNNEVKRGASNSVIQTLKCKKVSVKIMKINKKKRKKI